MDDTITLHICHWHDVYRSSLFEFLQTQSKEIKIVGQCSDYFQCAQWFENHYADYLLISFPPDEIRFLIQLHDLADKIPNTKIIVITVFEDKTMTPCYIRAGAFAHCLFENGKEAILNTIIN